MRYAQRPQPLRLLLVLTQRLRIEAAAQPPTPHVPTAPRSRTGPARPAPPRCPRARHGDRTHLRIRHLTRRERSGHHRQLPQGPTRPAPAHERRPSPPRNASSTNAHTSTPPTTPNPHGRRTRRPSPRTNTSPPRYCPDNDNISCSNRSNGSPRGGSQHPNQRHRSTTPPASTTVEPNAAVITSDIADAPRPEHHPRPASANHPGTGWHRRVETVHWSLTARTHPVEPLSSQLGATSTRSGPLRRRPLDGSPHYRRRLGSETAPGSVN